MSPVRTMQGGREPGINPVILYRFFIESEKSREFLTMLLFI